MKSPIEQKEFSGNSLKTSKNYILRNISKIKKNINFSKFFKGNYGKINWKIKALQEWGPRSYNHGS